MQGDDDKELYAGYWENLLELSGLVGSESIEKVKLENCALIANALETYMNKFVEVVEVDKGEMDRVYKSLLSELEDMRTTSDETAQLRDDTLDRLKNKVGPSLETAYKQHELGKSSRISGSGVSSASSNAGDNAENE